MCEGISMSTDLRKSTCWTALTFPLALGLALGFFGAVRGADEPAEFYHDFRGRPLPPELTVLGNSEFVRSEAEGLRITLPKDRAPLTALDIATRFGLHGDFEVTTTFEILHAEAPATGFGVGVLMSVRKTEPPHEGASIARLVRAPGKEVLFWDRSYAGPDGKLKFEGRTAPVAATRGQLRLKRTETILHYLWAAGMTGFEEIHKVNYGNNDVRRVAVGAVTGRQPCALDLRLIDLRVRHSGSMAAPTVPPAPPRGSWKVALAVVLFLTLLAGVGVAVWHGRRATGASEPLPDESSPRPR
jgi:hypothetical protein